MDTTIKVLGAYLLCRAFLDEAMSKAHPVIILTKVGGLKMRL